MTSDDFIRDIQKHINDIRNEWMMQAFGVERTHGEEDPAAKALRACNADMYDVDQEIEAFFHKNKSIEELKD